MDRHTPWVVKVERDTDGLYLRIEDQRTNTIGYANVGYNAALFVTAPELLEIAEKYADWVEGPDREWILEVIAKARAKDIT